MSIYRKLQGTQTLVNLARAFSMESQSRNRYLLYGEIAGKENMKVLEEIFLEAAQDERGHGAIFYDYLTSAVNNVIEEHTSLVYAALGSMADNLDAAAASEHLLWTEFYPSFGDLAAKEGFDTIARSFHAVASVEEFHDNRFRKYLERLNTSSLYIMDYVVEWRCLNCGYRYIGKEAPHICPACLHAKEYFILSCDGVSADCLKKA